MPKLFFESFINTSFLLLGIIKYNAIVQKTVAIFTKIIFGFHNAKHIKKILATIRKPLYLFHFFHVDVPFL